MKKLLKAFEVAEILGCSLDRTYSLSREGIIPSVKIGKSVRFSAEELENFINQGGKGLDKRKF